MMHWPQITMIVLFAIAGTVSIIEHGKPKGNYNMFVMGFSIALELFILIQGGFFG